MKKVTLLITALLLTMGFVQAQDVYVSGNHSTTGKVFKNNTLLYSITDSIDIQLQGIQVAEDGTVYGAGYAYDSSEVRGKVWMNDSCIFTADTNTYFDHFALNGNTWTAAGGNNVWQNSDLLYSYSHGEDECHIHDLAVDTTTGDIYAGGVISLSGEYLTYACIWKNDTLLWMADTISSIYSLCFDGENLYAAGHKFENDSLSYAVIWQNDSIIYQMENGDFGCITEFDGSLYWSGISMTDTIVRIWQDGEVLYTLPELSGISNLVVNESGVYYTDAQTVYKDGEVLYQPEECIITDLIVRPIPPPLEYTITLESANLEWGTVSGSGVFHYGDTATINAHPNVGCEFLYWNDSITDNPRDIVVTQDSTFIAYFGQLEYLIETEITPAGSGTVTGGGVYHYGDTLILEALPNVGFEFIDWTDGNTDNPRIVIVTESHTYTAHFGIQQCNITAEATPAGAGTVDGQGVYGYGSTIHLIAQNNMGYVFAQWGDGITENPRTILVQGDAHFIAEFDALEYEISTSWDPEDGGTVSGGGIYHYGDTASLVATANPNYLFICWSDGVATNPRNVIVTKNAAYRALFYHNGTPQYAINVLCNDTLLGIATGSGIYPEGSTIEISARPHEDAIFLRWDDGITDNPRQVTVTQDSTFTALFEKVETYTIEVLSENPLMGSVYGGGTYKANEVISIGAIPHGSFIFSGWQDGDTSNPRSITVTENASYTAYFSTVPISYYTITVYYDESQGFVLGGGTYEEGSTATLAAIPADNYVFVKWSDDNTDNPRTIVVSQDLILAAFFNTTGVEEHESPIHLYPNPADDHIRLEGFEGEAEISIFNAQGLKVKTTTLSGNNDIFIGDLAPGLYLVRVDKWQVKFIKR